MRTEPDASIARSATCRARLRRPQVQRLGSLTDLVGRAAWSDSDWEARLPCRVRRQQDLDLRDAFVALGRTLLAGHDLPSEGLQTSSRGQ